MDKFVKKWKSDSNAGSSSHRSAKNEKQTPVERAFSAMKIIKTDLRNKIGDDFLYHCLITYVKIDVFQNISTDAIMRTYQGNHDRKAILP
jgi:hypothetical protein